MFVVSLMSHVLKRQGQYRGQSYAPLPERLHWKLVVRMHMLGSFPSRAITICTGVLLGARVISVRAGQAPLHTSQQQRNYLVSEASRTRETWGAARRLASRRVIAFSSTACSTEHAWYSSTINSDCFAQLASICCCAAVA